MYKAFFEFNESKTSDLYKNFITKITNNKLVSGTNLSIRESSDSGNNFLKIAIQLDILEDFTYELKSSFQSYKESLSDVSTMASSILGFFDKLSTLNALSQSTSKSAELLKVQVWKETEPFRMNFKFSLQTKTDPFIDVYLPAILLSSQTILSPLGDVGDGNTYFKTPGVNQQKLSAQNKNNKLSAKDRNGSSKVLDTFAILVRNIQTFNETKTSKVSVSDTEYRSGESILSDYNPLMSIDYAFIETAKPTWSKERTESGVPLWCELELTVQSVFSANDSMFSFLYPEPDISLFDKGGVTQLAGNIANAGISKVVNVFR